LIFSSPCDDSLLVWQRRNLPQDMKSRYIVSVQSRTAHKGKSLSIESRRTANSNSPQKVLFRECSNIALVHAEPSASVAEVIWLLLWTCCVFTAPPRSSLSSAASLPPVLEFINILWSQNVHCRAYKSIQLIPIPRQINPVHITASYFSKTHFSIIFPPASRSF
jgi:hypothetical protein